MKYLESFVDALTTNIQNNDIPDSLDIILEGGAMNGSFHIGALCYLKSLEKSNKTKIMRISGVSCGALIGAMFLTSELHNIEEYYLKLTDCLLSSGNFSFLKKCIDDFLEKIDNTKLKSLTNRLYISYVDLNTQERVVISKYDNNDDLRNALIKTSFLPGLIDGSITTKDKCIDGGVPYIFPNDIIKRQTPSYKTLYLRLITLNMLKNSISTKGEINTARRAIEGIQNVHDLLKLKMSNSYASFVEDWSKYEIIHFSLINISWWIITYSVFILSWFYNDIVPTKVKEHKITLRTKGIIMELWNDYISRLIN
jgi:predicted patatin/cPLA2 family phospholipase